MNVDLRGPEGKYFGETARNYEALRRSGPHWRREQSAAEAMLRLIDMAPMTILDLPIGTGRFAPIYKELGVTLIGQDISEDMLALAERACTGVGLVDFRLEKGNAFAVALNDKSVDVSVCVRFMQHIDFDGFKIVLSELKRVSRSHILLGIHLVQEGRQGPARLLRAALISPLQTWRRVVKGVRRRLSPRRAEAAAASYMSRTDKREKDVAAELASLGLIVAQTREILTSLRPDKAVSYRLLLLRVPS